MAELEEQSLSLNLDSVLTELGFGRYQLMNLGLIGLMLMFSNLYPMSFTLTASDLKYRCKVPVCDDIENPVYDPGWLQRAVPYHNDEPRKCLRYKQSANATNNTNVGEVCPAALFNTNIQEECYDWIYETDEVTIVNEFHIMCESSKWELPMIGTINNVAQFFGIPIFGIVSDRYGRKKVAILSCLMSAVFGILRGLSTSYLMFAAFEFMDSFFGAAIYGTAFILGIELVNPKMRPLAATIIGTFYPIGAVLMGLVAWYVQNWRTMLIACYTPGLLFALYYWIIPESIRWLQMNGQHSQALKIIDKISKSNGIEFSERTVEEIKQALSIQDKEQNTNAASFWAPFKTAIKSKFLILRLVNCSFSWFSNTLVYYGLSINSVTLVGNKYLNFILSNLVEVPAFILSGYILEKVGRRISQSTAFFLSGIFCIICEFVPSDIYLVQIIFFLISKFLITISFNILYVYSAEMFPTELRLSLCGFASMIGRFGSMIAPQTVLLRDLLGKHAPVLLFGVISLIAGGLATSLPETKNKKLPDTVIETTKERSEG